MLANRFFVGGGHDVLRVFDSDDSVCVSGTQRQKNDWAGPVPSVYPGLDGCQGATFFLTEYYRGETTLYQWETVPRLVHDNGLLGVVSYA